VAIQYLDDPVGVVPPAPEEEQLTFQQKLKKIADSPPRDLTLAERAATSAPGRAILGIAERMGGHPISRGAVQSPQIAATTASDLYLGATQKTYEVIGAEDAAKEVEGVRRKAQGIDQDWEQWNAQQDKQFAGGETAARVLRGASRTITDALTAGGVMSKLGNASKGNSLMMQYYATRATQEAIQKNPGDWQNAMAHGLIDGISTGLSQYIDVPTSALAGVPQASTNRLMARAVARVKSRVPLPEAAIRGAFGAAVEAGSEVLTETAHYFADVSAGIEKLDWTKLGKRLAETAATAGLTGTAATSIQPVVDAMRKRHEMIPALLSEEAKSKHNRLLQREIDAGLVELPKVEAKPGAASDPAVTRADIEAEQSKQIIDFYNQRAADFDGLDTEKQLFDLAVREQRLVSRQRALALRDVAQTELEAALSEAGASTATRQSKQRMTERDAAQRDLDAVVADIAQQRETRQFERDVAQHDLEEVLQEITAWKQQAPKRATDAELAYLAELEKSAQQLKSQRIADDEVESGLQDITGHINHLQEGIAEADTILKELKVAMDIPATGRIAGGEKLLGKLPNKKGRQRGDIISEDVGPQMREVSQRRAEMVSALKEANKKLHDLRRRRRSDTERAQTAGDLEAADALIAEYMTGLAESDSAADPVPPPNEVAPARVIPPRTRAQRRIDSLTKKLERSKAKAAENARRAKEKKAGQRALVSEALAYYEDVKDALPPSVRAGLHDSAKAIRTPKQFAAWNTRVDKATDKFDRKLAKDSLAAAMDKANKYATRPEDRSAVDTILANVDTSDKKVREQAQVLVDWVAANPNAAVPAGYEQALKLVVVQPEQTKQADTKPSDFKTFVDEDGRKHFRSEEAARLSFLQQRVLHKLGLAPEATDLRGDSFKTELAEIDRAWWVEDADDKAAKKQLGDEIEKLGGQWKDRTGQNVGTIGGKKVLVDTSDPGLVPDRLLSEMESELTSRGELPAKPGSPKRHISELSSYETRELAEAIEAVAARAQAVQTFQTMATDQTHTDYAANVVSQIIQKRPTDSGLAGEVVSTAANIVFRPETIMASLSEDLRVLAWENIGIEGHRNYLSFSQSLLDDMSTLLRSIGLAPDRVVGATGQGGSALNVWRYAQRSIGGVPMTRAEAAHLYALSLDPEARSILIEGGASLQKTRKLRKKAQHVAINDGTLREIGDFLGAEGRRIVEHGFGRINTTMRDAVNAQWLVQYNAPLSMRNDYFPIRRDGDWVMENKSVETFMADMEQTVKDSYGEFGITKRREADLKTAVEVGDFFDVYSRHIDTTARIHGYMGPVRDFHAVYSKAEVKQAIVNKTSNAVYEGLLEAVKQQVLPVRDRDAFSAVARKLVHGSGAAILGLRIVTPFKNSLGLIAAQAQYAGGEAMLAAATAKAADPRNLERMEALLQTHSPVWRQRTGAYLNEATSGVGIDSRAFQPAGIADATLFHVSAADKLSGLVRGFMVEDYVQNTLGIDPKDARFNTEVAKEWERLLARTESTSIGLEMSGAQRAGKRHGVVASLTQFGSGASKTMSLLQSGRNDIRDGQYKRGVRKFAAFGTTAITDAVIGAMFAATAAGKEEELIDRVAGSLARLIPAVGEYVNQAYRYVRGKKVFSGPQDTLQTAAIDGLMGTADLYKAVESYLTSGLDDEGNPEYQEHAKKAAGRLSLLVGSITKLPTEGVADIYKRMANGLGIEGEERESLAKIVSDFTKATDISEPRGKIRAAIKTNDDALFLEAIEEIHSSAPKKLTQRMMTDAVNGLFSEVEKFEKNPQLLMRLTDSELRTLRYATEQRAALRSTLRDMLERNLGQIEKIVGTKQ
jgi:hypothetical protein